MEIFCKKNTNLSYQEVEVLYQMYCYNNAEILNNGINKNSLKRKKLDSVEYKENWIRSVLENDLLLCVECIENNYLIGFALLTLKEDENYINEFHIMKERQHDGFTFREMIKVIIQKSQAGKDFTGRIWTENYDAKKIFHSMGALPDGEKYRLSYDKAVKWTNKI